MGNQLTNALLTEVVALLGSAAAGRATADELLAMADRLAKAMAARSAKQAAAGGSKPGSGRPPMWIAVATDIHPVRWTQDVAAVAKWLGLAEGSLRTYLGRPAGKHHATVVFNREDLAVVVRRLTDQERGFLAEGQVPTGDQLWAPPAEEPRGPGHKKLA